MTTATPRHIAILGGHGFIGSALATRLRALGHQVYVLGRRSQPEVNFARLTRAQDWLPILQALPHADTVINCVGSLRGTASAPLQSTHTDAPKALFDACAQHGLRRVMQLSALGVDGNDTDYARTKRAADAHLLQLTNQGALDGVVVRPSIVIGARGASTQLFTQLAKLPVLVVPAVMRSRQIQPVAVQELAEAMAHLLLSPTTGLVALGGPTRLSMAGMIASLRQQSGHGAPLVISLPSLATRASARLGDVVAASPWCSASLELASHDNCCDPAPMAHWLGRAPTEPAQMRATLHTQKSE